VEGQQAWVGGGVVNAHLVRGLLKSGWTGMEFLSLIPGTFGGAVAMNAGTKDKELSAILVEFEILDPAQPRTVRTMTPQLAQMAYRHTEIPEGGIILGGRIVLENGDVVMAEQAVRQDKDRRNATQPYRLASVGSTFANPPGDFAGRLIQDVGLKGSAQGGARVSELHANFFINENQATAEDFLTLMARARVAVRQKFGVELRPEVCFVGFDGWSRLLEIEAELEKKC
jgi:UDP-N-acetylmuramate dehydrogenase